MTITLYKPTMYKPTVTTICSACGFIAGSKECNDAWDADIERTYREAVLTIYSKTHCSACEAAKAFYARLGTPFTVVTLDTPEAVQAFKERFPTVRSVPYVLDGAGVERTDWTDAHQ